MVEVSLADAKANLSRIIDDVLSGRSIDITRRGKPVARLTAVPAPRKRVDVDALRALTAPMAPQQQGAGDFIRDMRDSDRS